jgi:3-deoxy-D-manno-octulosonic-acid transferase
LEVKRTGEDRT